MGVATLALDLDGTLVDSAPDIGAALNRLMAARRLAGFSLAEVAAMVGDGSRRLVERAFAARGGNVDETAVAAFLADYTANAVVATRPYAGAAATLARLRQQGWRLAICTNKPEAAARKVLAAFGFVEFFAAIGGGDSFAARKPDPAHLLVTIAAAGGSAARAVMAGDHANDIAAAADAGIPAIFAAWGYGPIAMAQGAAAVAQNFAELAEIAPLLVD
ncbi:MAG TPA: HAD-IA family hydrolase [Stellaceae bacterium]|nr:HAD-IA family hydrolase [Stellaceae bacterium]